MARTPGAKNKPRDITPVVDPQTPLTYLPSRVTISVPYRESLMIQVRMCDEGDRRSLSSFIQSIVDKELGIVWPSLE